MKHDFNQLLLTLYRNPGEHYMAEQTDDKFNDLQTILEETSKQGLVYMGHNHKGTYFQISQKGKDLMAGLPAAYKHNPYDYFMSVQLQPAFPVMSSSLFPTHTAEEDEVEPPRQWYESWQFWIILMGIILGCISLLRRY